MTDAWLSPLPHFEQISGSVRGQSVTKRRRSRQHASSSRERGTLGPEQGVVVMKDAWLSPEVVRPDIMPSEALLQAEFITNPTTDTRHLNNGRAVFEKKAHGDNTTNKKDKTRHVKSFYDVVVVEDSGHLGTQHFASCLAPGGGAYSSRQRADEKGARSWVILKMASVQVVTHLRLEALEALGSFRKKSQVQKFKLQSSLSLHKPGPWMDVLVVDTAPSSGSHQYAIGTTGVISVFWRLVLLGNHGETSRFCVG
jgi:hypothetical protein